MGTIQAGADAERLAERLLSAAGLVILERNFRCRHGEIDLIAREADTYVFCEVRLRSSAGFGGAAESITVRKQQRIAAAARYFLAGRREAPCRFDVVLFDAPQAGAARWIRDAFST